MIFQGDNLLAFQCNSIIKKEKKNCGTSNRRIPRIKVFLGQKSPTGTAASKRLQRKIETTYPSQRVPSGKPGDAGEVFLF